MKLKKSGLFLFCLIAVFLITGVAGTAMAAKPAPPPTLPPTTPAPAPAFVIPIEIRASAYDAIGMSLVQRSADLFAADNRFKVVTSSEPSRVILHISTQGSKSSKDPVSAYGYAMTFKLADNPDRLFAGNTVGVCNLKEVPDDAKAIIEMTFNLVQNFPELLQKVKKPSK